LSPKRRLCVIEEDLFKNLQEFQLLETSSRILSYETNNIEQKEEKKKEDERDKQVNEEEAVVNVEEKINTEGEKQGNDKVSETVENERVKEDKDKKDKNEEEINNKDKTKCTLCDKTFSKKGLKAHVTKKH
jgi:hypothetical protein